MRESTAGTLLVLGAAAGFGTIAIFGEVAGAIGLDLGRLLPTRFAVASLLVGVLAAARDWSLPRTPRDVTTTAVLGTVYTAMTVFFFTSLEYLPAGLATIVLYTYPAFVVGLGAVAIDEPIGRRTLVALVLVTAGVALIVDADVGAADLAGVGLALGAAACYAVYTVGSRTLVGSLAPRALLVGVLVGTTMSMTAWALANGRLGLPRGTTEWGVTLGLAVVGTVLPLLLFYEGVARLEAGRVGIVSTAEPMVTVILGALLLGQAVTPTVAAGGALVLGGVAIVQRTRSTTDGLPHP